MSQQLKYYKEYRSKLAAVAGRRQARTILAEALYVVSTGTGDFIQNYYHNASLSARYDVDRYCDLLVSIFSGFADVSTLTHLLIIRISLAIPQHVTLWLTPWTYCRSCTGWGRGGSA